MEDVPTRVNSMIKSGEIVIFSKTTCPFCSDAKEIFQKIGKQFVAIELNTMESCSSIQDYLAQLTGARTVPRVFIKGKCYGGASDLKKMYETGELEEIFN